MPAHSKSSKKPPPEPEGDGSVVISSFRVPREIVDRFDVWLEEQNEGRRGPKLTRAFLIRGLMDWASETKPDWEGRGEKPTGKR